MVRPHKGEREKRLTEKMGRKKVNRKGEKRKRK